MRLILRDAFNLKHKNIYHSSVRNNFKYLSLIRYKSETMKYLNVAEKNDAAKNIALHLSRGTSRRREGLSQYNKIYEFEGEVMGQKAQMVMTSVSGHLLAMDFVGSYKNWNTCDALSLFSAPVFKYCPDNYQKIKLTLEREVRGCHGLIIWTDCDREGENIGFEIIEVCTAVKKNLQVFRAKFSEITGVSVRRALQNLEAPNKNISDAVDVRQELDLRIGAAFTRFQTLRLQKVFPSKLADSLISYGSCQFPTLGFVVERYRAVENFVSEMFWKLKVIHTLNNLSVEFVWDRVRLFDEDACQVLHDVCLESPQAKVRDVKTKPKSKWRPLPLDTVELEKLGSRKLKINAKETMRLAEKLYTQGLISYPRTETNEFPKEMNLATLVGQQTGDPNWGAFAQGILDSGGPTPRQGNKSDKAHPPIHPTKYTNGLSGNEQRLYEFIVRSFLACCSKDAQGQETTVTIDVAEEIFSASGLMITARNYLDVYPYDKWSSKEIHIYETGQTFNPTSIDMVTGSTSPPNLLTEADLIALMEKHGIGTDATHAEHIETIKNRSYVALADAIHFIPGLLGMGLVEGYDSMGLNISKPHLRAQLEADLKAISEGRKQPDVVLAEQIAKYKEVYLTVTAEARKIDAALGERFREQPLQPPPSSENIIANMPSVFKCPKCGSEMCVRQKKNNADEFYIGCMLYPRCKNAVWLPSFVKSLEVMPQTCSQCGPNYKKIKFEWRNNSISHIYPSPCISCIGGCDRTFLELLKINISSVRNTGENQTQTNNRSHTDNVNTRTNPVTARANQIPAVRNQAPVARNQVTTGPSNVNLINRQQTFLPPISVNRPPSTTNNRIPTPHDDNAENNEVFCACNRPAILLTVRKQNANFGKKFYKCQTGKENNGCDFFQWANESTNVQNDFETPPPSTSSWGNSSHTSHSFDDNRTWDAPSSEVTCECGLPGKKITVQKEGPNKGRLFYGCANEFSKRCKFFKWADEAISTSDSAISPPPFRGRGRGRGAGGGAGRGAGAGGARKCGICKREGHNRTNCPTIR
ncbi:DNA topoisomerase 3-alpha [Manduca sexta]|uniref:DNA topoisomerase 3-alpha n=1 Tax=Manduca sexta TaxID=7130 RepID=UPI00188E4084|nr:DNA topoisomerase 3-alpha [Manduca sexta]